MNHTLEILIIENTFRKLNTFYFQILGFQSNIKIYLCNEKREYIHLSDGFCASRTQHYRPVTCMKVNICTVKKIQLVRLFYFKLEALL